MTKPRLICRSDPSPKNPKYEFLSCVHPLPLCRLSVPPRPGPLLPQYMIDISKAVAQGEEGVRVGGPELWAEIMILTLL